MVRDQAVDTIPAQKACLNRYDYGATLPKLEKEYKARYKDFPVHCFYVDAALVATRSMMQTNIRNLEKLTEDTTQTTLKRWDEVSQELDGFLETATPGDVWRTKTYRLFAPGAVQQFRTTPLAEPAVLTNGTSMVDIGFVDFGIVFDSIHSLDIEGEPLLVTGYDMEPMCVAKSLIMLEMMKDDAVATRNVIEVWLSSLWSKATLSAFKRASRKVLDFSEEGCDILAPEVRAIVKYWNGLKAISSKAAILFQFRAADGSSSFAMSACCLQEEFDRVRYTRYFLTKALYEDSTTVVGSIVMNSENERLRVIQMFQDCFETAPAGVHLPHSVTYQDGSGFFERTTNYFEKQMAQLITCVRKKVVLFRPRLGFFSKANTALIEEVKSLNPYLISWGNVIDYIHPIEFHEAAKEMSGPETVHYIHSCNWLNRVFGADVLDVNPAVRLYFFAGGLLFYEQTSCLLVGFRRNVVAHYRDICAALLSRKFVDAFFQFFFEGQEVKCSCFNGTTPLKIAYSFAKSGYASHVVFSYEEGNTVVFPAYDNYDYGG